MTIRQARKVIKRIRKGARYPERTRNRAADVEWRAHRRRVRWAMAPLMTGRVYVTVKAEATILVAIEERAT